MDNSIWTDRGFWSDIISFVGFPLTFLGIWQAIQAAKRAESAASRAQEYLRRFDVVGEVTAIVSSFSAMKRMLLDNKMMDLYYAASEVRIRLVKVRSSATFLSAEDASDIQGAVVLMREIENSTNQSIQTTKAYRNLQSSLDRLGERSEKLTEIAEKAKTLGVENGR